MFHPGERSTDVADGDDLRADGDAMSEADQFVVDAPVAPRRVVGGHLQDELAKYAELVAQHDDLSSR